MYGHWTWDGGRVGDFFFSFVGQVNLPDEGVQAWRKCYLPLRDGVWHDWLRGCGLLISGCYRHTTTWLVYPDGRRVLGKGRRRAGAHTKKKSRSEDEFK